MFSTLSKRRLLSLGLGLAILSGCTSVDLGESDEHAVSATDETAQGQEGQGQDGNLDSGHDITPVQQQDEATDPLQDPNSPLAKREVFFEFDSFAILPEYQPIIEAHANYLSAHRRVRQPRIQPGPGSEACRCRAPCPQHAGRRREPDGIHQLRRGETPRLRHRRVVPFAEPPG